MDLNYLYSKTIIPICLILVLISCKKESITNSPPSINPSGLWKLNSIFLFDTVDGEQLDNMQVENSFSFITSCSTQLTLHDSSAIYFATLSLSPIFIYESWYKDKHINYDSTYNTCLPQYILDTTSSKFQGTCEKDAEHISITYIYHYSPGGAALYNTQTYAVLESTNTTLKISGSYPFGYFLSTRTGVFTFSR